MTPTERKKLAYRAAHARIEVLVEALGREYCRLSPREQKAVTDLAGYIAGLMNVAELHDGTIPRPRSPYAGHPWDDRIRDDPDEHQQWCPSWKNCGGTTDGVCTCSDVKAPPAIREAGPTQREEALMPDSQEVELRAAILESGAIRLRVVASHDPVGDYTAEIFIDEEFGCVDLKSNLEQTLTMRGAKGMTRWLRRIIEGYGLEKDNFTRR